MTPLEDPRKTPSFVVKIVGDPGAGKTSIASALMDFPLATDDDLARLRVLDDVGPEDGARVDAIVYVVRGTPAKTARTTLDRLETLSRILFVAAHARDLDRARDEKAHVAWSKVHDAGRVFLTSTPVAGVVTGVDALRGALVQTALDGIDVTVERARRAKRPYATAIIASAALVTAAEGLLPGAAAFVMATQVGAITSLYYLYKGKWLGRTQALALLPVFASEAAGGSAFLIAKSFLPPTGVADAIAAGVAASMTIAMLGAVTWALEQGYSLDEKTELKMAFRRLQAKTKLERAEIARNRARWREKIFWEDLVKRLIFD